MRNNDEIAIYESYRDEILNKFKNSLEGEDQNEEPNEKENIEDSDVDVENDIDSDEDVDNEVEEKQPKKKVIVKSEELSRNVGIQLREILRRLPPVSEDTEILSNLKKAIEKYNSTVTNEEDLIKSSPLKIYDELIELNAISEEEMDENDIPDFEKSGGEEPDVLQSFEGEDYREFDDETPDWEKENEAEREKDKLRELIRQAGTDWRKDDEDFYSSNY